MAEAYMTMEERRAQVLSYLGKTVHVGIDRPIGYVHHKETYDLVYPINYGYIPEVFGGDGEELDVYILGADRPLDEADVRIVGIVYRENDVEDKLVGAVDERFYTAREMADAVHFQEQYYDSHVLDLVGDKT